MLLLSRWIVYRLIPRVSLFMSSLRLSSVVPEVGGSIVVRAIAFTCISLKDVHMNIRQLHDAQDLSVL